MSLFNILLHQPVSMGKGKELQMAQKNRVCAYDTAQWVDVHPTESRVTALYVHSIVVPQEGNHLPVQVSS